MMISMISAEMIEDARAHVLRELPREACFLIAGGELIPCDNVHVEPTAHFRIAAETILETIDRLGPIAAVLHSHPSGKRGPTKHDMIQQQAMAVPWGIMAVQGGFPMAPVWFGDQVDIAPLIEREFIFGVWDCYSLIRDWYRLERNIALPNFPREDDWWKNGEDMYRELFREAGFREVFRDPGAPVIDRDAALRGIREGDILVGKVLPEIKVPHHGAVYLGGERILHHLAARLSKREPVHRWFKFMTNCYRREQEGFERGFQETTP